MMEEVSDDTNGESSFEFVSGKIDEVSKDENMPVPSSEPFFISTTSPDSTRHFPVPVPSLTPTFPVASQNTGSNTITFYNVDPKDTKSVMLPPLLPPPSGSSQVPSVPSATTSHYPPVQQSSSPLVASPQSSSPHSYLTTAAAPPLSSPPQSYLAAAAAPPLSSPPQSYLATTAAPQPYFSPPSQHSLSLPLDPSDTIPAMQQQPSEGVWGWLKGKDFLNKVAEKAKNSVDSVITTLDPGMKEIINSGGDVNVIVASGNEDKISAVREAFQQVFGKATVQGVAVQSSSIAPQPVGFSAGLKAAEERINNLKQMGFAQDRQTLLSIENFLVELTPDNWFDMGCLLLQDQSSGISLQVYTEAISVSSQYVALAKDQTPSDYPLGWSGYAVTIGQIMGPALGVHHSLWHQALTGVSRREILFLAAKTIAGLYKFQLVR